MTAPSLLVGLFVGGKSTRMGGIAKGALRAPDSELSLVERLLVEIRAAAPEAAVALVGGASVYGYLGLEAIPDDPPQIGPLGGLASLLELARSRGAGHVLALACDLPRLDRSLLARLVHGTPDAAVVLVKQGDTRNPLIARYAVAPAALAVSAALAQGQRSLQAVLDRLEPRVLALALTPDEAARLDDWDTPSDMLNEQ
jgi:molybdopterin-guanine dinucleotide biosynthesis protein A